MRSAVLHNMVVMCPSLEILTLGALPLEARGCGLGSQSRGLVLLLAFKATHGVYINPMRKFCVYALDHKSTGCVRGSTAA